MAARTIVTSQPDVACDVCERRLLRGEQPDVFVVAGRRRIVCELCAPRAAHEGWLRETESQPVSMPPLRPRRGRSLFDRLPVPFRVRQVGTPRGTPSRAHPEGHRQAGRPAGDADGAPAAGPSDEQGQEPYDLFGDSTHAEGHTLKDAPPPGAQAGRQAGADPVPARPARSQPAEPAPSHDAATLVEVGSETGAALEQPSSYVEQAIVVFNASEFPRRVAGLTRSLGAPAVTVRSAEHLSSVVSIVVAWELCWYRYEVDLSEPVAEAQLIGQGTELAELAREDRRANAAAGKSGTLALAAV